MFWIVETKDQLNSLMHRGISNIFLEFITENDYQHPAISNVIALYIKDLDSKESFIVSFTHSESLKELDFMDCMLRIKHLNPRIYVYNKKRVLGWLLKDMTVMCLKTANYLANCPLKDPLSCNTKVHSFFYSKYPDKPNINSIIPLTKHHEKYENFISSIRISDEMFNNKVYEFYDFYIVQGFHYVESSGIKIDLDTFNKFYSPKSSNFSVSDGRVYSEYNIFTNTGRPSNTFNGINFAALKKDTGERCSFIAKNDYLVEFDYKSYHPRILASIVGYDFGTEDVYDHISNLYYGSATKEQREEIKSLTFRLLYTDYVPEGFENIEYFKLVKELKEFLWNSYNKKNYILSPITKRKICNIDSKVKILPYLCQTVETERNSITIKNIKDLLLFKDTELVLYTYDSFLFDLNKSDGKSLLYDIQLVIESNDDKIIYPTNIKYGKNYGNLE